MDFHDLCGAVNQRVATTLARLHFSGEISLSINTPDVSLQQRDRSEGAGST
jgi:hypothetical protein